MADRNLRLLLDDEPDEPREGYKDDPDSAEESDEDIEKNERLRGIHAEAIEEFNSIQSALKDERMQCLNDRRFAFIAGGQWEGPLGEQFKNKPKYEINKVLQAIKAITTDYLNNRSDSTFISKDGALDEDLADTCASLHRADSQDSSAAEAYRNAFIEGTTGGMGAWMVTTRYEDEENDEEGEPQRIQIKPIYDADRFVWFDLDAREYDKSDARCAFLLVSLTPREFKRRYPHEEPSNWPETVHAVEFDWATPDVIYLAYYYPVEFVPDTKCVYAPPGGIGEEVTHYGSELKKDPSIVEELLAKGYRRTTRKKVKRKRVRKYLMNGKEIIKDYGYIAGCEIPLIPFYGDRVYIDNVERVRGHVRSSQDAQRVKNMLLSKLASLSAESSAAKPILTPEQILNHKETWAKDNVTPNPYLPINPVTNQDGNKQPMGPVGFTKPTEVPPVTGLLHQLVDQDLKELLSNPDPAGKVVSHVTTKAIEASQQSVDAKSAPYIHNMGIALRRSGQVWLGMAPELYNQPGRKMKGVDARGELQRIELLTPTVGADKQITVANDLSRAKFDVAVEVGPSSSSKREAAVRMGTSILAVTQDPETQSVMTQYIVANMDGEGAKGLRKWARRKLVKLGVEDPTPEEQKALDAEAAAAQPSANDQYLMAEAEKAKALAAKAQADTAKAQADVALIAAQTEKTRADAAVALARIGLDQHKTLAEIDLNRHVARVDTVKSLHEMASAPKPDSGGTARGGPASPGEG